MTGVLSAEVAFPKFPTLDPYGPNTTLLLHGDGATGAQNNIFIDSSPNIFSITRNGNTTQGTFSPFSQPNGYWSNYFNGSSDYLYAASNAAFAVGTGDFTVEAWVYVPSWPTYAPIIAVNVTGGLWVGKNGSNFVLRAFSVADQLSTATLPPTNQWTHIAVVRSGSTASIYYNGLLIVSGTVTYNFAQGTAYIGNDAAVAYFSGYISNFRLVKGTAVYTSNFTPPTTPLTAISGTSLLTCQSNYFKDNSTNAFAITPSGAPSVQAFHPISAPTAYYPAVNGGAGYFDGSGDYLSVASNAAFAFGTGDFTIEFLAYIPSWTSDAQLIGCHQSFVGYDWLVQQYTSGQFRWLDSSLTLQSGTAPPINQWNHYAITRSGTTLRIFLNGTQTASGTSTANIPNTRALCIMSDTSGTASQIGYVSNVRIVKGTAVYTSNFAPPTAPLTAITNTQLLLSCTNAGIIDSVSQNALETVGNAQVSTTQSKFGGASMYFDGTGDGLLAPYNPQLTFGSSDFTIEFWIYRSGSGVTQGVFDERAVSTNETRPTIYINSSNSIIYGTAGADRITTSLSQNTWTHVAVVKSSNVTSMYINGNSIGTYADTNTYLAPTGGVRIGYLIDGYPLNGYIDDFRVTTGIARYTQNFTPPQNASPDYGPLTNIPTVDPAFNYNTVLLHGNGTDGTQNNSFIDSSSNAFSITRNGNTTQGTFTPFSQPNGWWSNYFNGSTDFLTVPSNAVFQFGTGDFTIECWINKPAAANGPILDARGAGIAAPYALYVDANNYPYFYDVTFYTSSISIVNNQWNHVAVVRTSGVLKIFVNGSQGYSASNTVTISPSATVYLGGQNFSGSASYTQGYISNLRVVKGTAVYTSNFTPSTLPLTAITNTSLLTCQSSSFKDNSTNAFAITPSGTPSVQNRYPFFPPLDYSTAAIGGSGYFDGSGDYLSVAGGLPSGQGTAFTLECFIYLSNLSNYRVITRGDSSGYLDFGIDSTGSIKLENTTVGSICASPSGTITANQWYHVALTRSTGNIYKIWANGVNVATSSANSTNITANTTIGYSSFSASHYFVGYISNFRVVSSELYTSTFTPPTAPLTAITNTQLLLSCTNAGIFDNTSKTVLETVGGAKISNTQSKFGGTSMYFDGSGDGLYAPNSPNLTFGTADFTIEFWIYRVGNNVYQVVFDERIDATTQARPTIYFNSVTNKLVYYTQGSEKITGVVDVNIWTHAAVVRSSSVTTLYINGTSVGTYADTNDYLAPTTGVYIGSAFNGNSLNGFLQDFRITNGFARYRYNFTPPLALFPNK